MPEWIVVHPYWAVAMVVLLVYFIANIVLFRILAVQDEMLEGAAIREKIVASVVMLLFASLILIFAAVYDKFLSEKDEEDDLENQE